MDKKRVAILGATGSIGKQALEVVRAQSDVLEVSLLTAQQNADTLIKQALQFHPKRVVIADEKYYALVKDALGPKGIEVMAGQAALAEAVQAEDIDIVLTALVGYAGLRPTMAAIAAGKHIAIANKETLVVAGALVTEMAREKGVRILPVDSEHSAIFQCLIGEEQNPIEKIILTASGGPFRGKDRAYLQHVTKDQALKHPNWSMGAKITIDSATLMNKGLEVIEARWLFGVDKTQIDVVLHPQSIIHSMVQFEDGSIKAQLGLPDMRLPIQYALTYPHRVENNFERFSFLKHPTLTFEAPDSDTFENLHLAYVALGKGGNMPCILNAANEVAVQCFLEEKINFLQIADLNEACMEKVAFIAKPTYEDYVQTDAVTRRIALELVS